MARVWRGPPYLPGPSRSQPDNAKRPPVNVSAGQRPFLAPVAGSGFEPL